MKTNVNVFGKKSVFGISANISGQKSAVVNAEPTFTVNSTPGKFSVTAPVSKALNIAVGENIQIFDNIAGVEAAIAARTPEIVEAATQLGVDIDTREGQLAIVEAATEYYVGKGVAKFKADGSPLMVSERWSLDRKTAYLEEHKDELRAKLREDNPDATNKQIEAALVPENVTSDETQGFTGSKTSTTSANTGVGVSLGFSDTAIWNKMKSNLTEKEKTKVNRIFKVDIDTPITTQVHDGHKLVDVTVFALSYVKDGAVMVRGKKDAK